MSESLSSSFLIWNANDELVWDCDVVFVLSIKGFFEILIIYLVYFGMC